AEKANEVLERVERLLLAMSKDHFLRDALIRSSRLAGPRNARVAAGVEVLDRIVEIQRVALAPPVPRGKSVDRRRAARGGDIPRGHLGSHDRDQIVGPDQTVERFDKRRPDLA